MGKLGVVMSAIRPCKFKICFIGENAVGKTCLIRRYIFNEFSDDYVGTIGTLVSKKKLIIERPKTKELVCVDLMIWDIMGQQGFRKLLQQAYFAGAHGIIAVCDNTREQTLSRLEDWVDEVQNVTKEVPTVFLGNKCDLEDSQEIGLNEIRSFASGYESAGAYISSAKTGRNVDLSFDILSKKILENLP